MPAWLSRFLITLVAYQYFNMLDIFMFILKYYFVLNNFIYYFYYLIIKMTWYFRKIHHLSNRVFRGKKFYVRSKITLYMFL